MPKKHEKYALSSIRPRGIGIGNYIISIIGIIFLLVCVVFLAPPLSQVRNGAPATVFPAMLNFLANIERGTNNANELTYNPLLSYAAQMKAEDMATKQYFAHTSPDGITPWYWLEKAGYAYDYAGENLALNFTNAKDVADAWMRSPTHRSNLLKSTYTEIGTGVATGTYQGKEAVFIVQLYAHPQSSSY